MNKVELQYLLKQIEKRDNLTRVIDTIDRCINKNEPRGDFGNIVNLKISCLINDGNGLKENVQDRVEFFERTSDYINIEAQLRILASIRNEYFAELNNIKAELVNKGYTD